MEMSRVSFDKELSERVESADRILKKYLPGDVGQADRVMEAVRYSVSAGGKRLRPVIMREAYMMYGGRDEYIEPLMASLELIHNYSLVHDDLPAMDNDRFRRGKETTHVVFGDGMATLAGDCMLNLSFETALKAFGMVPEGLSGEQRLMVYERIIAAVRILMEKAGVYGMLGGQSADVDAEKRGLKVDPEKLLFIHEKKTAALIEAALMSGAALAGAGEEDRRVLMEIGSNIGLAFQIKDDILDVSGDEDKLGKPVGSDLENGKVTYVTLYGLEKAEEDQRRYSEAAIEKLQSLNKDAGFLTELVKRLINREM